MIPIYFGRTTRGLETLAWDDVSRLHGCVLEAMHHRTIVFHAAATPQELAALRSLEDLFVLAGSAHGLDHTRASLSRLRREARQLSFAQPLQICAQLRAIPPAARFTITASFVGKRNYSRWDIAEAVSAGVIENTGWSYVETRERSFQEHDIHLRVVLEDDFALFGVRLAKVPLADRPYKRCHLPGSLNPVVAYLMAGLAQVPAGGRLLDPMCGAGTIPIESALAFPEVSVIGGDLSDEALRVMRQNVPDGVNLTILKLDAHALALGARSISAVVCDLPWGHQTSMLGKQAGLDGVLAECARVISPEGSIVLLTDQTEQLREAAGSTSLQLTRAIAISLYGRHAAIHVLRPPGA